MTNMELSKEQINLVIELFSNGKQKEAIENIESLNGQYPNNALLFNIKGACYADLRSYDSAVKAYERAISIKPDYYKAHFNLGGVLQELGHLDAAVKSFNQALTINPNYAEAHNNIGNVFRELNQLDDAINSYEKAIIIQPDYIEAQYSLGRTFQDLNKIDSAIKCYKEILIIKPDFAEMHNNLGVLFQELGQMDFATEHLEKALLIMPKFAEAHNNLGNVLKNLGRLDEALSCYEIAISIKPEYAEAHFNLGIIFQEIEKFNEALDQYEKTIAIKPDYAEAHNNLGIILKEVGRIDSSIKSFNQALIINPSYVEANYNLGASFHELGQFNKAIKQFEKTISIKEDYAEAHNNLGITFKELGQFDLAIKSYERAILINSEYAEAYNNLGNVLKTLGKTFEAIKNYEETLKIKPDYAEAHNNLGITFMHIGELSKSVKSYEKALNINPNYAEVHNNIGIVFGMLGSLEASLKSYEKALAIKPNYADTHSNLGNLMIDLKRLNDALFNYERANELKPNIPFNFGNLLHTKMHLSLWSDLTNQCNKVITKINNNEKSIDPFSLLALIDDPKLHKKAAEIYINDKYPKNLDLPSIGMYPKHKKIRIGYFSADFRIHPVANLTAELYEIHNRSQFEVYAFSFGPDTNDEMNLRIKAGVDYFHDVFSMSHREVALLARSLELDIAIDLGGFTQDTRTGIFAMQAAPIQVNYLGYSSTMGANYMDYIIADPTLIPKNKQQYYSEKIAYLPDSFMVNDTKNKKSTKKFTREEAGLPNKGFVFCCFNNYYKITPLIFASWMKILSEVDGSILWLSDGNKTGISNLKKAAKKHGIDKNRLIFAPRLDLREDHLSRIKLADLFLDTLPYNAHATTSDALQVGLPVLTRIGESFASRVAASLINSVNMPELITSTSDQYEALAIKLATDSSKFKVIKDKLKNNLPLSPLYDTPLYAKQIEDAYLSMYGRYQKGLEPDHIYV